MVKELVRHYTIVEGYAGQESSKEDKLRYRGKGVASYHPRLQYQSCCYDHFLNLVGMAKKSNDAKSRGKNFGLVER